MVKISEVLNTRLETIKAQYNHAWHIEQYLLQKWFEANGNLNAPDELVDEIGELHSRAKKVTMRLRAKVDTYRKIIKAEEE